MHSANFKKCDCKNGYGRSSASKKKKKKDLERQQERRKEKEKEEFQEEIQKRARQQQKAIHFFNLYKGDTCWKSIQVCTFIVIIIVTIYLF